MPVDQERRLIVVGAAIACLGHLVAGAPLLFTVADFMFSPFPSSIFLGVLLSMVLEIPLAMVCVGPGVLLRYSSWPHLGIGLLAGWAFGLIGLLSAPNVIVAIALITSPFSGGW